MGSSIGAGKIIFIVIAAILAISLVAYGVMRVTVFADSASDKISMTSDDFNQQWKRYGTTINGSDLNPFVAAIAKNNKDNKSDASKLIDVAYQVSETDEFIVINSTVAYPKFDELNRIKSDFISRHGYYIDYIISDSTGNISGIVIKYNKNIKYTLVPNEK